VHAYRADADVNCWGAETAVDAAIQVLREASDTRSIPGARVFWALRQLEKAKLEVGKNMGNHLGFLGPKDFSHNHILLDTHDRSFLSPPRAGEGKTGGRDEYRLFRCTQSGFSGTYGLFTQSYFFG
jgi:hypothetical protein